MSKSVSTLKLVEISIFAILIGSFGCKINSVEAQDSQYQYDGQPALSPDGTKIAFISYRNGDSHLWMMNSDGSDPVDLMPDSRSQIATNPIWSPDSQQILFRLDKDFNGIASLWSVSLENRTPQNLTLDITDNVGRVQFSPNGKIIVFETFESSDKSTLWLMDSDGQNRRKLFWGDQNYSPQWSPDGKSISYKSGQSNSTKLKLTDIETGKTRILATNLIQDYAWAPQSNQIIYIAPKPERPQVSDVWLVQTDTLSKIKLNDNPLALISGIAWSPDEEKIAFRSSCGANIDIVMLVLKPKSFVNITCEQGNNFFVSWLLDSEHLLFDSNRSGKTSIWIMSVDGKDAVDLINPK